MADVISGTFTGTGASGILQSSLVAFNIEFGTGTVEIQWSKDATNWTTIESKTADTAQYAGPGPTLWWRLNCTAHSVDIDYWIAG